MNEILERKNHNESMVNLMNTIYKANFIKIELDSSISSNFLISSHKY